MNAAGEGCERTSGIEHGRLSSLWQMINRQIFPICELLMRLTLEEAMFEQLMMPGTVPAEALRAPASKELMTRISAIFEFANNLSAQFDIPAARDRITKFDET